MRKDFRNKGVNAARVDFYVEHINEIAESQDEVVKGIKTIAKILKLVNECVERCKGNPEKISKDVLTGLSECMDFIHDLVEEILAIDGWEYVLNQALPEHVKRKCVLRSGSHQMLLERHLTRFHGRLPL